MIIKKITSMLRRLALGRDCESPASPASGDAPPQEGLEVRKAHNRQARRDEAEEQARRLETLERGVVAAEKTAGTHDSGTVLFCNFTSSPTTLSFHALAGLIMSWSLRCAGHRVLNLVCNHGMVMCPQGTNAGDHAARPPCEDCFGRRNLLYAKEHSCHLIASPGASVKVAELKSLPLSELTDYTFEGVNYGELCLPSVRWALRKGRLEDNPATRFVYAEYLASAMHMRKQTVELLEKSDIRKAVVFNGTFFPEAAVCSALNDAGIPIISYEAGFRHNSIFLSHQTATLYRLHIPEGFAMGDAENKELDEYLSVRASGNFNMGGTKFWPEMASMSPLLLEKCRAYACIVTVFTNVIYDTSQTYANEAFGDMFEWMDAMLDLASKHRGTLFIVRAHPDEARPRQESRDSVEDYLDSHGVSALKNVEFISPRDYVSSYELVQSSRFCIVYNGTIGVEATMMGVPVVSGGHARYHDARITLHAETETDFRQTVERLIADPEPAVEDEVVARARRYFYYSVFKAGLDFSRFIERVGTWDTVMPTDIDAALLHPSHSRELAMIHEGILAGAPLDYPCGSDHE